MKIKLQENQKEKYPYGMISNIWYNLRSAKEYDSRLYRFQFLQLLPAIAKKVLGIFLPSWLVFGLTAGWSLPCLLGCMCLTSGAIWIFSLLYLKMNSYCYCMGTDFPNFYAEKCFRKMMSLDYDLLSKPEIQRLTGNVWSGLRNIWDVRNSVTALPDSVLSLIVMLGYGTFIAVKNPLLLLFMMLSMAVSLSFLAWAKKKHQQYHEKLSDCTRKTDYISRRSVESVAGKDVRLYQMLDLFLKKYDEALAEMDSIYGKIHLWYFYRDLSDCLLSFFRNSFAYIFLAYLMATGKMSISSFVLYIGMIDGFSSCFLTFTDNIVKLNPMILFMNYVRKFLAIENAWGKDEGVSRQMPESQTSSEAVKIEMRDVSYTYPGNESPTLSKLNLVVMPGEKMALLGLNGAGKTTLVKLLCGFLKPTEGEILINDVPIDAYDRQVYYQLVSVLFQDHTFLPLSVDANLTGQPGEKIDRERLTWALQTSGFYEKYESLPQKGDTMLVREVHEDAIDFSGGERQKFLFARALYKKAPLLILDEPTAALDPIAENEMYLKYSEAAGGRTSLYISHRLSSTRFCDRIILLEHGQIAEEGTHESLMQKGGRYAELFGVQSRYYKEQEEGRKRSEMMGDTYQPDTGRKEGIFHE